MSHELELAVRDNCVGSGLGPLALSILSYLSFHVAIFIFLSPLSLAPNFLAPTWSAFGPEKGGRFG